MADNIALNPSVGGGDSARAEDVGGGVKIPASKIYTGAHGVDGGPVSATNPLPVAIVDGGGDGATADVVQVSGLDVPSPVDALATFDQHTPQRPLSVGIADGGADGALAAVVQSGGTNALATSLTDPSLREAIEATRIAVEQLVEIGSVLPQPHMYASPASANALGIVTRPAGANTLSTWYGVRVTDGTFAMPAMDATTRRGYVAITDGANQMPTMDVVARKGFFQLTDGVSAAAVKAASTAAAAADPALVVALSPNSGVVGAQATGAKQTAAPLVIGGADEQGLARTASVVQRNGSTPLRTYDEDNRALLEQAVMLLTDIRTVLVHLLPAGANPSLSGLSEN